MALHGIPISAIDESWFERREVAATAGPCEMDHADLLEGLASTPKRIPSKYFYDDSGSRLFSRIMELPEYYPTRCEEEILRTQAADVLKACGNPEVLNIIELGAGDGRKTLHLLRAAGEVTKQVVYQPVDISEGALRTLEARVRRELPELDVKTQTLDLGGDLADLPRIPGACNLVLYLGSTIGNGSPDEQLAFFRRLRARLRRGDFLLTGFDLKKEKWILQRAYDDGAGVTREFNLNLLRRLNREFGSEIDETKFRHMAVFNAGTGSMESWLVSLERQTVELPHVDCRFELEPLEGIHVETSWKFSEEEIDRLAQESGFHAWQRFFDGRRWFVDDLWIC